MMMDEHEICYFLKYAADKNERLTICAQMNECSVEKIVEIFHRNGMHITVPKVTKGRKRKWTEERIDRLKAALASGVNRKEAARLFGVSVYNINDVVHRYIKKAPDGETPGEAV